MIEASSRLQGVEELIDGKQYFVIHAARQSGKTTYLKDLVNRLNAAGKYYVLYCSLERAQGIIDPKEGIPAIIRSIKAYMKYTALPQTGFASDADYTDYNNVLCTSLTDFCILLDKPLVILFDEADCLSESTWQFFEFTFKAGNSVSGGAWVNNDRDKTATIAYLDNWHIYDTAFAGNTANVDPEAVGDCPITPVSFVDVSLTDNFWAPRIRRNQDVTIPIALEQCYSTGRVDNFKKAGGLMSGYFNTEYTFDDTDIYKILEGMSYSIQNYPNPDQEKQMDSLIYFIGLAQEPDGYLYTARTLYIQSHLPVTQQAKAVGHAVL
jgi:hypothetical protein